MNNKFIIGNKVVCKIGGPEMLIYNVPAQGNNNVNAFIAQPQGMFQGAFYTCVWWREDMQQFYQFFFPEDALDDAPTK